MQEVRLDLATYDELQDSVRKKTALEHELVKVKEAHEAEIEKLVNERKVAQAMQEFESETGLKLTDIGFIRRSVCCEGTCIEEDFRYVVETRIEL